VLPNVVRIFFPTVVGGNQLWSIGVEEQFYLVWPLLVNKFISRIIPFLAMFIGLKLVFTLGFEVWMSYNNAALIKQFHRLWVLLQVEQMAVGAIGAWVLFAQKEKILKVIYHPTTHTMGLILMASLFVLPIHHWWINYVEAAVFVVVIMNLSTNPAISFNMENKLFSALGNISYGIYMYHTLCITISLYLLRSFGAEHWNIWLFNTLLYTLSVALTIAISYVSYEYFEKRFLDLKERFMVVKSGKDAVQATEPKNERTSDPSPVCQPVVTPKVKSLL
jgi:peptidoglycan/LPS O-acetylase OafA/YrhL